MLLPLYSNIEKILRRNSLYLMLVLKQLHFRKTAKYVRAHLTQYNPNLFCGISIEPWVYLAELSNLIAEWRGKSKTFIFSRTKRDCWLHTLQFTHYSLITPCLTQFGVRVQTSLKLPKDIIAIFLKIPRGVQYNRLSREKLLRIFIRLQITEL